MREIYRNFLNWPSLGDMQKPLICIFETVAGDTFSVPRPTLSQEEEAEVINVLRGILKDEGIL